MEKEKKELLTVIKKIEDLHSSASLKNKALCLDIGDKRIGMAVSDDLRLTAQSKGVIERKNIKSDLSEILNVIKTSQVGELVIGIPYNMNGSLGSQAKKVFDFIDKLKSKTDIPVYPWDERLSSSAVEKVLINAKVRRQKRKKIIDKMAAQYILQGYLDYKKIKDRESELEGQG